MLQNYSGKQKKTVGGVLKLTCILTTNVNCL